MAILVNIQEHQLPNCIGYLSDNPATFPQSNSCGIFHCSGIENLSSGCCFAIQIYGHRPPFHYLHLNRIFIERQGFKRGDRVILEPVKDVQTCELMEVVPETYNDWNIIENTSCIIEEIFLRQIRVLQPRMGFVLFLSPGITANLRVAQLIPKIAEGSVVLANNSTRVLVAPINNPSTSKQTPASLISSPQNENIGFQDPISKFLSEERKCKSRFLRVVPKFLVNLDDFELPISTLVIIDETSYIKSELVRIEGSDLSEPQFGTLIILPKNAINLSGKWLELNEILAKESSNMCYLSEDFRSAGLNDFTHFKCQTLKRRDVRKISSLRYSCSIETSTEIVKKSLFDFYQNSLIYSPCLLTSNENRNVLKLRYQENNYYFIKLTSDDLKSHPNSCGYFWPDSMPELKEDKTPLKLRSENKGNKLVPENYGYKSTEVTDFLFQHELCLEFVDSLLIRLRLKSDNISMGHLLITGASFAGKSTLMELVSRFLFDQIRVFSTYVDCNEFKGKSPDVIANILNVQLRALKLRQPSVLLLDNLDFLNRYVEDDDRKRFISKVYSKIGNLIVDSRIQLIASAHNKSALLPEFINFNGQQFFTDILEIKHMKEKDYVEIFDKLLNIDVTESNDLLRKVERLNLGETIKLCNRLRLTHQKEEQIRIESIVEAIDNLPSVNKAQNNEAKTSFDHIGGYEQLKQKLREVFLWPMQFSDIYKSVGIRIGNGAILYGPSGCGKTLIARGLASEIGLNVIHIKGPELLSKYIGASEENVRKVFERARQSKPSLIIFDEFDSLVPKRGHDNTGVTDRVVNQFLTELDGVDSSMDGIYVLAATNRLDLIDVALLRPGRFDHKILVGLPTKEDRLEILRLQCQDICLEKEANLESLAAITENWSGAELRGLIVNAMFEASRGLAEKERPIITQKILKSSFKSALESRNNSRENNKIIKGSRVSLA